MNTSLKLASYIPVGLLSLTYLSHGIMSLMLTDEHLALFSSIDLYYEIIPYLVTAGGVMDCIVAVLLIFKHKIIPVLPWKCLFLYAGLWPIVPRIMEWNNGNPFPWIEVIIFSSVATLAYYLKRTRINTN